MRFTLEKTFTEMAGGSSNGQLTYSTYGGKTYGRARVVPADAKTSEQERMRAILAKVAGHWGTLSMEQLRQWEEYARQNRGCGMPQLASGYAAFTLANTYRRMLGLPLTDDAPAAAPPSAPGATELIPGEPADALRIRIAHAHPDPSGMALFARITPATSSRGRKPRPKELRAICGVGAASAVALPPSGGETVFTPTRFAIESGQRFAMELRIVRTSDGMPSVAVWRDCLKP